MLISQTDYATEVKRVYCITPGPNDPPARPENQWHFEQHYRMWMWPTIARRGYKRYRRTVTFSANRVLITVVDQRDDGREIASMCA